MRVDLIAPPAFYGHHPVVLDDETLWCELPVCPICETAEHLLDVAVVRGTPGASMKTSVCTRCTYMFQRRRPTEEWMESFYEADWDQQGRMGQHRLPLRALLQRTRRYGRRVARRILRRPSKAPGNPRPPIAPKVFNFCREVVDLPAEVLDIGCGFGSLLQSFRQGGYQVVGVEQSAHRAHQVNTSVGIECHNLGIRNLAAGNLNRRFDLVISNHVLEHLFDPNVYFEALRTLLKPGGYAYIAVPDLHNGEYLPQFFHSALHLSGFTPQALEQLAAKHGFRTVKLEVNSEIQFLFRQGGPEEEGASTRAAPQEFMERLSADLAEQITGGLGEGAAERPERMLRWHITGDTHRAYESDVNGSGSFQIPLARLSMSRVAKRMAGGLPKRVLPYLLGQPGHSRFMLVRIKRMRLEHVKQPPQQGEAWTRTMPLEFVHQGTRAPFWVK